ncbi:hypothetical protein L6452_37932 [Arctium lappa]|uniref:Uncharacterized protein n=1 Tax=Arctium lappa TaxID=4217 RepID=A0ACB8Y4C5_ARCLA|nr:hypothetical protein L6452_37932 [Arctium lappa]
MEVVGFHFLTTLLLNPAKPSSSFFDSILIRIEVIFFRVSLSRQRSPPFSAGTTTTVTLIQLSSFIRISIFNW